MDRPQGGRMSSKDVDTPDRYVTKSFSQNPFPLKTKYPFPHKTKYYVYLQIDVLALLIKLIWKGGCRGGGFILFLMISLYRFFFNFCGLITAVKTPPSSPRES